jgi:GNAT superfamily N-acetyltransferase
MFEIRPIGADENLAAKRLIEESLKEYFNFDFDESYHLDLNYLYSIYNKAGNIFLVLLKEDTIVATGGLLQIDAERAEIKRISVKKEYRQQRLGSRILKSLEENARRLKYRKLVLQTNNDWNEAKMFYLHNGYDEGETKEGWTFFEKNLVMKNKEL